MPFKFKYKGTEIKYHNIKKVYGDDIPSEEHIQMMIKLIDNRVKKLKKFVEEAERKGVKLEEKYERGQSAIYYGEKNYKKISSSIRKEDNEKVRIEYLGPKVDYDALADKLQEKYAVIEGYHEDKYKLSDAQFFHLMKMCLEKFNARNKNPKNPKISPDALYYAFYKTFPLTGSQSRMSVIFENLAKEYGSNQDLYLEHWRTEKEKVTKTNFFSHGNYFRVCLPYGEKHACRFQCYSRFRFSKEAKTMIPNFNNKYVIIYLSKSVKIEKRFVGFLDALFGAEHAETEPVDFCKIAGKYLQETNRTCEELYEFVLDLDGITFAEPSAELQFKKSYQERRLKFDEVRAEHKRKLAKKIKDDFPEKLKEEQWNYYRKMTKEEIESFQAEHQNKMEMDEPLCKPCSHFGPCGPDQENCSCKKWCSEQCGCDINCSRRFPGCQCPPGGCDEVEYCDKNGRGKAVRCICAEEWRECVQGLCNGCLKFETEETIPSIKMCKNTVFQRGIDCKVDARKSAISGTGAFLTVDVQKGECIGEYVGAYISESEAIRRDNLFFYGISYVHGLPYSLGCIDAAFVGNETRFVNHDDQNPNCETVCRFVNGIPRLAFRALKDIKADTEAVFNYGYSEANARRMFDKTPEQRAPQLQKPGPSNVNKRRAPVSTGVRTSIKFKASRRHESDEKDENRNNVGK